MLMDVLRCFHGYTLSTVLDMPYCHFLRLYGMTHQVEHMNVLTYLTARSAPYDKNLLRQVVAVQDERLASREVFDMLVTEEAKEQVNSLYNV